MTKDIIDRFPTARSAPAGPRYGRNEVLLRRIGIVILAALVVTGLLGYLGPSSHTVSRTGAAGTVEMEYDAITRPGVDAEVAVTLRPEQSTGSLVLSIDQDIVETYGIDVFAPEPVEQRTQGNRIVLEFAAADGDDFRVRISGRTPTTQPPGRTPWQLRWLVGGSTAATLDATTWVMP